MALDSDARQLDTIYEVAWDPGAMDDALRDLAIACRSRSAGVYGLHDGRLTWEHSHNMPDTFMDAYAREAVPRDPRIAYSLARPAQTIMDDSRKPLRAAMQISGIDAFARHYDLPYTFATMLGEPDRGEVMALYVSRSATEGPPGEAELEAFARLAPHFGRALQLHKRIRGDLAAGLGAGKRERGASLGVLALDRHGRVRWLDGGAEFLLAGSSGIRMAGARLVCSDAALNVAIARKLWALGRGLPLQGEAVFHVMQPSPPGVLRMRLLPIPADGGDRQACALMLLQRGRTPDAVSGSIGPTPRQGEVLVLLAQGLMSKQIAARLGISVNTVRNHVGELLQAFGASTRTACVARARERGLID